MQHILSYSFDTFIDENTNIIVQINGEEIFSSKVEQPNLTAESLEETEDTVIKNFEDNESIEYEIHISSSFGNIKVDLYGNDPVDENEYEILLETTAEESSLPKKSYIKTYVPLIKYTGTTKELVAKTLANAKNKEVIPLIDIRKEKNIQKYIDDNFNIIHFLDLFELTTVSNTEERERIKDFRKENKGQKDLIQLPPENEVPVDIESIINNYIDISKKQDIIPVWRINTVKPASLKDGQIAHRLLANFKSIVIRIINIKNFFTNIQSYLLPLLPILKNSYLLIEFTGLDDLNEQKLLSFFKNLNTNMQVIYAKETTDYNSHTIARNYPNIFPNTSLSSYIDRLSDSDSSLYYSDYCGYDRNTAIEYIPGMKPNVSLYLLDKNDAFEIFIFKIKHPDEVGSPSWKKSAELMIKKIQANEISDNFLELAHCEGCYEILAAKSITLTKAKHWSMLHNCITIAKI